MAVRTQSFVFVQEHVFQFQPISLVERLIENRAGNFESDEIVIAVRRVTLASDLENVEPKFGLHMREPPVLIRNAIAVFFRRLG